ncbi:MAG: hypothetical protein K2P90_03655 [Holosporales bacterium]|nr:hypothetical protein [Holosporales bacterium]
MKKFHFSLPIDRNLLQTVFLVLEGDCLSLFRGEVSEPLLFLNWSEEKEKLISWLENNKMRNCQVFLDLPEQNLNFEVFPRGLSVGDCLRFLKARWHMVKNQSLFWWFRPFLPPAAELTTLTIPATVALRELLKILDRYGPFKVYSLSLRRVFQARNSAQKQGASFALGTLTFIVDSQSPQVRFFLFLGDRLILVRSFVREPEEDEALGRQKEVEAGEETLSYVRAHRSLKNEPVFWIWLGDKKESPTDSLRALCLMKRPFWAFNFLSGRLFLNRRMLPLRSRGFSFVSQKIMMAGFFVIGGGVFSYESISLYHRYCLYRYLEKQTLGLQKQVEAFHKDTSFLDGTSQEIRMLKPFMNRTPFPLKILQKLSKTLPSSLQVKGFQWGKGRAGSSFCDLDLDAVSWGQQIGAFKQQDFMKALQEKMKATSIKKRFTSSETLRIKMIWAPSKK